MKSSCLTPRPPSLRGKGVTSACTSIGDRTAIRHPLPCERSERIREGGRAAMGGVRSLDQVFALAPIEALRQLLGIKDPGAAALEEAVVLRQDRGDQTAARAANDVDLGKQRQELDPLAVMLMIVWITSKVERDS